MPPQQPMAEVFGYQIDDMSPEAVRHRRDRLCPFNNKVPSCTKDKIQNPLGVCSLYYQNGTAIICPVRFRESWIPISDAAEFFFPAGAKWTSLGEITLDDAYGRSAGNIDYVLVSYDEKGQLLDFGSLEVQGVYISGNNRKPFDAYMKDPQANAHMKWPKPWPRPDFLSSSRKRLVPQLLYKGNILHSWGRKMAVAVDQAFFNTLPNLPQVEPAAADVAWLIYDLNENPQDNRFHLARVQTVYTEFAPALSSITTSEPGPEADFRKILQTRLREQQQRAARGASIETLIDMFSPDDSIVVEED